MSERRPIECCSLPISWLRLARCAHASAACGRSLRNFSGEEALSFRNVLALAGANARSLPKEDPMAMQDTMETRTTELPPGQVTDPNTLTTDEARQGVTGFGVRYVLAFSLGGALMALVVAWLVIAT